MSQMRFFSWEAPARLAALAMLPLLLFGQLAFSVQAPASQTATQVGAGDVERLLDQRFDITDSTGGFNADLPTYAVKYSDAQIADQRARGEKFATDLLAAVKDKKHDFTVSPGVYLVPGVKVRFDAVDGLTINCAGVTFITENVGRGIDLFGCHACKNITVRGPMIWDTTTLPYREGKIVALDQAAMTFDLELFPDYRVEEYPRTNKRFHVFDPAGKLLTWCQQVYVSATPVGGRRVRVQLRPDWFNWSDPMVGGQQMKVGNVVAMEGGGGSLTTYGDCENMTLQDITIYTGVAQLYEQHTRGFSKQINVRCITPPGTNRLIAGQPIQHMMSNGSLIYDGCEFGVGWDDGINLLSLFHMVAQQPAPHELIVASRQGPVNVGAALTFYDFDTFNTAATATVTAVEKFSNPATVDEIVAFTRKQRMTAIDKVGLYRVTLDRDVAVKPHAIIETSDERADEVIVRNCYFHDANAQVLLLQGARKGLVENNLLVRSAGPAVQMGFSVYWWEGPVPSHFVIRNNVIRDNPVYLPTPGETPASICVWGYTMKPTTARLFHDITIENNTIVNSSCSAIEVRNADGVIIRNNSIVNPDWRRLIDRQGKPVKFKNAGITLGSVSHVTVTGNDIDLSNSLCKDAILLDTDVDRATVNIADNHIIPSSVVSSAPAEDAESAVKLPSLFCDHMVLQREQPVPVWGSAGPGESVTVEFAGQTKTAKADSAGKWKLTLDPMPASADARDLKINGTVLRDILVGDVWLCSGQSNMGFNVQSAKNGEQEVASANYPRIRLFTVAQHPDLQPADDVKGSWDLCSPQTVGNFSAAAYFFGRELNKQLNVPIGLLHSSVGGTPAEAWTRMAALNAIPELAGRASKEVAQIQAQENDNKRFLADRAAWEQKYGVTPPPIADAAHDWADPALDTSDWKTVTLPANWAQLGAASGGTFWLRKSVTLPDDAAGKPFSLSINWVNEQYDTTFFNGVQIGHASDKAPDFYCVQRYYHVPGKLVKAGPNVITVRLVSATQFAGMWQWGHMLGLPIPDPGVIDNQWLMKTESTFAPLPSGALDSRPKPNIAVARSVSSSLYNGMIAPLIPFAIKGAIWYQGENNAGRAGEYRDLLSLMIRDWRAQWGEGDFPFIIQQLVNNDAPPKDANQTGAWPYLREAQMQVADSVPNCAISVGIELGDPLTIHPKDKQDVGKRLAMVALEKVYGQKIESSGPRYGSMKIEGSAIRIKFTHAAGLFAKDGDLKRFAIAGVDKKFVWADAKIAPAANGADPSADSVIVSSPQVPNPVAVRYAWSDNPQGCNLYNQAQLPAAPFRTDDWPAR